MEGRKEGEKRSHSKVKASGTGRSWNAKEETIVVAVVVVVLGDQSVPILNKEIMLLAIISNKYFCSLFAFCSSEVVWRLRLLLLLLQLQLRKQSP